MIIAVDLLLIEIPRNNGSDEHRRCNSDLEVFGGNNFLILDWIVVLWTASMFNVSWIEIESKLL